MHKRGLSLSQQGLQGWCPPRVGLCPPSVIQDWHPPCAGLITLLVPSKCWE